jgi:hypothetical protein
MIATELALLKRLIDETGVHLPDFSWVYQLDDESYLKVISCLERLLTTGEVGDDIKLRIKLCFSDVRARGRFSTILGWFFSELDQAGRLGLEVALSRTYSKSDCGWTWEQLEGRNVDEWPLILAKKLWRDGAPREIIRERLAEWLLNGGRSVYALNEIAKIGDDQLSALILSLEPVPNVVQRTILGKRGGRARQPMREAISRERLVDCEEIFSSEIDESEFIRVLAVTSESIGWPKAKVELRGDGSDFQMDQFTVLHRESCDSQERLLVGTREDDSTVIIRWLVRQI